MERGDKIELLVKKTHALNTESGVLKGRSEKLKEKARSEAMRRGLIAGAVVIGIIAVIYFL